jgi:O-acetyl-ADP-ribose deacetylase (regulator of RNase III)
VIEFVHGDLLKAEVDALVNTVNTVGIMGKGIALQFKQAFPKNFKEYERACKRKDVKLGKMFVVKMNDMFQPRYIINFPTKNHWKGKAKIEDIQEGLFDLARVIKKEGIHSIAVPPLGCGNGGLDWNDVQSLIETRLKSIPDVKILVYPPQDAPRPETMKVATEPPSWTSARAAVVALLGAYIVPGYRLSMLEVQKLAYFLQESGESLQLKFEKAQYGPYANNLKHLLQRIDQHFIVGYGDGTSGNLISVKPNALNEAREVLQDKRETLQRLDSVTKLIRGFETPYGLELLSSVHWVIKESPTISNNIESVTKAIHSWNKHKKETFVPRHIQVAWRRLKDRDWIPT